ncbi:MAG TPA: hypothetical protein VFG58_07535 [Solirubrobacterales bacterium]|nr:hypothetical protein [Solirubrobacterales bacterium]
MRRLTGDHDSASDATKETRTMHHKRLATLAALICAAALLLIALPVASASAEGSPWWQVLSGSRPTNLWEAPDETEIQEIESEESPSSGVLAAKIKVGGSVVGCLGAGTYLGTFSADEVCQLLGVAPEATETSADLKTLLEGVYGVPVSVTGGPAGGAPPLRVSTAWGVPQLEIEELSPPSEFGTAESEVTSEGSGRLVVTATNLGDAPLDATGTPLTIVDEMPEHVLAYGAQAVAGNTGGGQPGAGPVSCTVESAGALVSCTFEDELPSYEAIEVEIEVALDSSSAGAPGRVTVSGGDGPSESVSQPVEVSSAPVPYGLEIFDVESEEEGGARAEQAGLHPFQWTNTVQWNSGPQSSSDRGVATVEQPATPRNTRVILPPGFVGNANAVPRCDLSKFLTSAPYFSNECPADTAVGVASVTIIEPATFQMARIPTPIFNLTPQHGEPARFGFTPVAPVFIDTAVDPDHGYKITTEVRNATQTVQVLSATLSIWGVPGDPRHDSSRGWACALHGAAAEAELGPCEKPSAAPIPFLRMPVACHEPLDFRAELEPWNTPIGSFVVPGSSIAPALRGCNREPFDPKLDLTPTSKLAESSSGLDATLTMPNAGLDNPADGAISETQFKKVEVELPEGVTVNPSEAEGLATCSPADYARERFDSGPGEGCPEASKIGNVKISTPLLEEEAEGALYIATPHENPFDSLIALYLVARVPERGVLVKQAGNVTPDPRTGQLVTTFDDVPQMPVSSFKLHFREGGRAPLVTPPHCGTFQTTVRYVPWSAQDPSNPQPGEIVERQTPFTIEHGVDGGGCPPGGVPPFNPGFSAGALNNDAGSFSEFDMRLTRRDGEQDMTKFSVKLPAGQLGSLAGVGKCPDSAIAAAKAKTGKEELASPSCPSTSEIGSTLAGAGVGSVLTYVPGKLYLGGPFHGDPLSVIAITPAVAGPFDVGTVVVHEALTLNPRTAEVEVDGAASDPIPHILAGIPLKLRDLRVDVDRPHFTLNPTSCEEMSTRAKLFGSNVNVFDPADDVPVNLSARYQAASCASLGFKPRLNFKLRGGTRRGAHPAFQAVYRPRPNHQANLKDLVARLPRSAFLDQGHIRTICTRVQFAASRCPKAAQYGYIKAWTPLLDEPLQGPVWLRSSNHKLPDLVFDLHGLVNVEVVSRLDSFKGGIRATIENAPDAPLSAVVLRMQGGKKGLIVNSRNICRHVNRVAVGMTAQNGKTRAVKPVLRDQRCGKQRKAKRKHRRHHRRSPRR